MTINVRRYQRVLAGLLRGTQSFSTTYHFAAVDFGAGDSTQLIAGPAGKVGRVVSIDLHTVTETFTEDTTPARVEIGTAADADRYAVSQSVGTLAATAALNATYTGGADTPIDADDADIQVSFIAPTGGVPAGISDVAVTVLWT